MGNLINFLFIVLAVILVACGGESESVDESALPDMVPTMERATDTPTKATNTPTPATNTLVNVKEPVTCDGVEGPCVEVTFDGENCLVDKPLGAANNPAGLYVFAFNNAYDGVAGIEAAKPGKDMWFQGLQEYYVGRTWEPGFVPEWIILTGMVQQPVGAGESAKYQHSLESGNYAIYCYRDGTYVIHGDNLHVR